MKFLSIITEQYRKYTYQQSMMWVGKELNAGELGRKINVKKEYLKLKFMIYVNSRS